MIGLDRIIENALLEDIHTGDITTLAVIAENRPAQARIIAKEPMVLSGIAVAAKVFHFLDHKIEFISHFTDGCTLEPGDVIADIRGEAALLLQGERVALNLLQRMCGIATRTARFVQAVAGLNVQILDTRKTTPGLRVFEKYSVRCGGGVNHRFGLDDRVLIKDNHRRLWQSGDPDRLDLAIAAARQRFPDLLVEIEVESLDELRSALRGQPDWVLLDNMPCDLMRICVAQCRGVAQVEASGGMTLERVREVALTGVDAISVGGLTHSALAVDLSLEWE